MLIDGEPDLGPWCAAPVGVVLDRLLTTPARGRPTVIAVDGRGGAGKSSIAALLQAEAHRRGLRSAVVHTDDFAWHESFFGWDGALRRAVLEPVRLGEGVDHVPPAWRARGRLGSVPVPVGCQVLLVEGSGSARRALAPVVDKTVWVQVDGRCAVQRLLGRDGDTPQNRAFLREWAAVERPFMLAERPWERADLVAMSGGATTLMISSIGRTSPLVPDPGTWGQREGLSSR
ncbi:uridine kinase family protein [Pseudonocardia halophobica]|uniref:uridine kinase family protein n=1 Tax=Pseudonocardia halophobica TaxID=29401 RepID=UPI003D91945D